MYTLHLLKQNQTCFPRWALIKIQHAFAQVFSKKKKKKKKDMREDVKQRKSNLILGPSSNLQHPRWSANNSSLKSQRETMDKKINLTTT